MTLTCSVQDQDPNPPRLFEFVLPNEDNLQVPEEEQVCQSRHARRSTRSARSAATPLQKSADELRLIICARPSWSWMTNQSLQGLSWMIETPSATAILGNRSTLSVWKNEFSLGP